MSKGEGAILAPDGYQYGVMFMDGSVASRWSGATQRQRAEDEILAMIDQHARYWAAIRHEARPPDPYVLVRRLPGGEWEAV